ncbi:bifunctional tetrahydrofolate synthase/dihydrofolate synthase [Sansalvadorimonas sp. 2012CJ34-2]|uniref:Dihydrofolate synthase/folylpolyglutamate synthase n=1 Tax=Parendozoicomonas callyspongiae TaxID=2942213 RepID=A0ABT0PDS1_9GAMM|nr:bifunctional tetrahydrofolate synthase/dihydrofolate synthase [Sansalvadorimonas sp. 2012CJ34-2]MCL6268693.1 bifunctional tetrahydrofolate synthase/dihydrofolate synthase [Sansalvadorimonas sp. 2012CJ34-2]
MNFDSLAAWLTFLEARRPEHQMMLGLERADTVARQLLPASFFTPERPIKVITVAGTNGKGSTVAYLSAILKEAGIRAGAWTSPHLLDYNERIRIDGEMVSDDLICDAFTRIEEIRGETFLSYYEFGALAALDIFVQENVDVILLEVGLGGRLDAVNIIDADVSIVTTVDLDHQDWLGDTVEEIAREKAGVFRTGRPAISGERFPAQSLLDHIADIQAIRLQNDHEFSLDPVDGEMHFTGRLSNGEMRTVTGLTVPTLPPVSAACALQALLWLVPDLSDQVLRKGFASASLAGRCQQQTAQNSRGETVNIILDVAHNPQAARYLAGKLEQVGKGTVRAVLGMLNDKDMVGVIEPLKSSFQHWYVASVGYEARARSSGDLAARLQGFDQSVSEHGSVPEALSIAVDDVVEGDTLVILGSFHTVAESLAYLKQLPGV